MQQAQDNDLTDTGQGCNRHRTMTLV